MFLGLASRASRRDGAYVKLPDANARNTCPWPCACYRVGASTSAFARTGRACQARRRHPTRTCVLCRCTAHRFCNNAREAYAWKLFIVEEIAFHSPKGNATKLHFTLVSVLRSAARVTVRDHPIKSPTVRQQRGTFTVASFRCGRFQKNYAHVTRATIIAADGEHSNSVDFTVSCNLAAIS